MVQIEQMIHWLKNEAAIWITKGIITPQQRDLILALYRVQPQAAESVQKGMVKPESRINIARVILVLAVICIAVGLIIFYASNWRKMPPVVKLVQVFLLIITCYSASWYLLFIKNEVFTGRLILMLSMFTFGIGIMLVAQVYHISSHPTNGIMAWAVGALAMSALMEERWGCYMSLALFATWNWWEVIEFGSSAWPFIIPLILLGLLFYRIKDAAGIVLCAVFAVIYWFQVNLHYAAGRHETAYIALAFLLYPFGALLMTGGRIIRSWNLFSPAGGIITGSGWILFIVPLLVFSWPYRIPETGHLLCAPEGTAPYLIQFAVFTVLAITGVLILRRRGINPVIYLPFIASAVILILVPHYNTTARMVSTHIVIVVLIASSLGYAYRPGGDRSTEKIMAFSITTIIFLVKWAGLTGSADTSEGYTIAYLGGFIIFATVLFLINRMVKYVTAAGAYPSQILDILTSMSIWITLYIASFKIENQKSIFSAERVVIIMIFLFIALAILLYTWLLSRLREKRIIIYLSMAVFISSGITIFIARDGVSWITYSLVFNILLFIATGTAIYYSTVIQSRMLLNVAVCAFILHIGTRYFDLFWDMLSGSVLFITTGIIGLAGGYLLERNRRRIIESFDTVEAKHE